MEGLSKRRSNEGGNVRKILIAAALAAIVGGAATPALAHDGWGDGRGEWREHQRREWRAHEWREHHRYGYPAYAYGAPGYVYAPPPRVYYAPPPVYYVPPPAPIYSAPATASLNFVFPFR